MYHKPFVKPMYLNSNYQVKKPNGDNYAADSVLYLTYGIQEYLFENGRIDNIFTDQYYEPFTSALHEVVKDFKVAPFDPDLSDTHSLISATLSSIPPDNPPITEPHDASDDDTSTNSRIIRFNWKKEESLKFGVFLTKQEAQLEKLISKIESNPTQSQIDELTKVIGNELLEASIEVGSSKES